MQLVITTTGIEQASVELRDMARRVKDWRPILDDFGVHMIRSVNRTFEVGGRPEAWPTSIRVLKKGGKTLIDHGHLKDSIVPSVIGNTLRIGTNVPYAAVHQMGYDGTVQIPQHLRYVKSRDVYQRQQRTSKKTGRSYKKKQWIASGFAVIKAHAAHLHIPQRAFLVVQDEDLQILEGMMERHITKSGS